RARGYTGYVTSKSNQLLAFSVLANNYECSPSQMKRKMEKLKGNLAKAVPLGKTGLAEDISEAALYLASDAGKFVTCHDLVVDGGRSVAYNEPQHKEGQ
ncbi:MAG TPA: SDR family oxidoreductase, partial [Gammaproteobacteria bacterium]|nr:SDR family oxidoreductase [Gammaproteobacteria bacterium]